MNIWPPKPFSSTKLSIDTMIFGSAGNYTKLRAIMDSLFLKGFIVPNELLEACEKTRRGTGWHRIYHYYDPDHPWSFLAIYLYHCMNIEVYKNPNDHSENSEHYIIDIPNESVLFLTTTYGYKPTPISKDFLIECLKDDIKYTLRLFNGEGLAFMPGSPAPDIITPFDDSSRMFRHARENNKDLLKFLIVEGLKINPKEVVYALDRGKSMGLPDFRQLKKSLGSRNFGPEDLNLDDETIIKIKDACYY